MSLIGSVSFKLRQGGGSGSTWMASLMVLEVEVAAADEGGRGKVQIAGKKL